MKKVLVFHSWGIGDLIMATPMLRTLAINGYKVDLFLTSEANSLVIKNAPFINRVFVSRSYLNIFLFSIIFSSDNIFFSFYKRFV